MRFLSFIALLVGLYFCSIKSDSLVESEKDLIRTEIKQMFVDYDQAVQQKGLIGEFDYLDNSDDFFWVPPGFQSALNYDSVRNVLLQNSEKFKFIHFEWIDQNIYPLTKNIANYTGLVKSQMIDNQGVETISYILETGTVIRRENGWKLLSGQSRLKE